MNVLVVVSKKSTGNRLSLSTKISCWFFNFCIFILKKSILNLICSTDLHSSNSSHDELSSIFYRFKWKSFDKRNFRYLLIGIQIGRLWRFSPPILRHSGHKFLKIQHCLLGWQGLNQMPKTNLTLLFYNGSI